MPQDKPTELTWRDFPALNPNHPVRLKMNRDYARKTEQLRLAAIGQRENEIARTCARFEFESDEFKTAREKAVEYLNTGHISARY